MKKLLNLVLILIIGFITCGCTQGNICDKPLEWNGEHDTKEYKEYIYNYTTKCQIAPATKTNHFTQNTVTIIYKFYTVLISDYYNDILPNVQKTTNETLLNLVISIFGATADDVINEYGFYTVDPYMFHERYVGFFEEVQQIYPLQTIYNRLDTLITYMDSQGYFEDYRVVDMFCRYFVTFIDVDIDKNLPVFEPLIFKVAIKNRYKDNAFYDQYAIGSYYHKDKYYYMKYFPQKQP